MLNSNSIDDDEQNVEEKDYTRPTFIRNAGEIGIFIDVYDAIPNDKNAFGSRQYFLMTLKDRFYKEICLGEIYKIKGFFTKRNLLNDITLEYFRPGVLLIVNINKKEAVSELMSYYENGKLNGAFVECFVTPKLEQRMDVTQLKLKIKIFTDEIEMVHYEWIKGILPRPYKLIDSEKDMKMVDLIKRYQNKAFSKKMVKLKDEESQFEIHAPEFIVYLKQFCDIPTPEMKNIQDIQKLYNEFSKNEDASVGLYLFRDYLQLISDIQTVIRDVETHVTFPLSQIRIGTETNDQIRVNKLIRQKISDLKSAMKEKAPLKLYSQQMDSYITNTDRKVWGGLMYLIPAAVSLLNDIDQQIDDYFQLGNFNEIITEYEHQKNKS